MVQPTHCFSVSDSKPTMRIYYKENLGNVLINLDDTTRRYTFCIYASSSAHKYNLGKHIFDIDIEIGYNVTRSR